MHLSRQCVALGLILTLASCAQPSRQPEPPAKASAPIAPPDVKGAALYAIDPQASELHILVYRGGKLARLGHNHVVSSKSLSGIAWLHRDDFSSSGFQISMPVHSLIVDDAQARAANGQEFSASVPQKDIEGTRRNLLKPELLDGDRFEHITIVAASVSGTPDHPKVIASITIKDVSRQVEIPLTLDAEDMQLTATGEFEILQTDFGMKPFSVALGALEVQDRLQIRYRINAQRTSS
jgi:polyisoprenoid-binding protein YceI